MTTTTLTNEAIGEMIGLTHSAVSRLLTGERTPGGPTIQSIAKAFNRPVEEVFKAAIGDPKTQDRTTRRQNWAAYFRSVIEEYQPAVAAETTTS